MKTVNTAKTNRINQAVRVILSVLLIMPLTTGYYLASTKQAAYAAGEQTISDVLGVSRQDIINELSNHEHDTFYLTTRYMPYDWRSPNGDPSFNGQPGMNCTGFVWYALIASGSDPNLTPAMNEWVPLIRNNNILHYSYNTKQEMLADGKLEKGDIIWMFDQDAGGMDGLSDISHVGIFWGDSPQDDKLWHSTTTSHAAPWSESPGNIISEIMPKADNVLFVVVKTERSGFLQLEKRSADPSITAHNTCYSLAGAEYTVYDYNGAVVDVLITDSNGITQQSVELPIGTYTYKETKAPRGFILDNKTYTVNISPNSWNTERLTWLYPDPDDFTTGTDPNALVVTVHKSDLETGKQAPQGSATLEGAEFIVRHYALTPSTVNTIADLAGKTPDYTWTTTTDANGRAVISRWQSDDNQETIGIPLGVCTIEETKAPTGYLLNSTIQLFKVGTNSPVKYIDLDNIPITPDQVKRGDLELIKLSDGSHQRLANVLFKLTSLTTGESHTITTDINGFASTAASWNPHTQDTNGKTSESGIWFGINAPNNNQGALIYDTYSVEEQPCEANAGKTLIPAFEVTITRNAHTVNLGTLTNDNLPKVTISKCDITTNKELLGATLAVYDSENNLIEQWVSTDKPHELALEPGDYTLHEVLAPDGYLLASDVAFTIVSGTVSQAVVMKDDYTKLQFSKQDATTGKELPGATLQIKDLDGKILYEWISTDEPHQIDRLIPGKYILHETIAPDGYLLSQDVEFTVEADGAIQKVIMQDALEPKEPKEPTSTETPKEGFPKTGDDFPWYLIPILTGAALCIASAIAIRKRHIKDQSNQQDYTDD